MKEILEINNIAKISHQRKFCTGWIAFFIVFKMENSSSSNNNNIHTHIWGGGCPRGVMVKAMDCGIVVSEFEFQSCYYVHFVTNTLGKGMNPLILPAMG